MNCAFSRIEKDDCLCGAPTYTSAAITRLFYGTSNSYGGGNRRRSLELEADARRRVDIVARQIAVGKPAIHVREHEANVGVELVGKLPVENGRRSIKRACAL